MMANVQGPVSVLGFGVFLHIPPLLLQSGVAVEKLLTRKIAKIKSADEITVSAPNHRVDLEALKRPKLGGKEPSDDDYRLRFAHALPADSDGGYGDRRV